MLGNMVVSSVGTGGAAMHEPPGKGSPKANEGYARRYMTVA